MQRFQQKRTALGSEAILTLITPDEELANDLFDEIWTIINEFENRFSRFLPDSELIKINKTAGREIEISGEMRDILIEAQLYSQNTGGLFNPFILPVLLKAGYVTSWTTQLPAPEITAKNVATTDDIVITGNTLLIPFNTALDLGGIGKGYLLDIIADEIKHKVPDFWFSLGGDVIASGGDINDTTWQIGIADALDEHKTIAQVSIPKGETWSVATSGIGKRHGTFDGKHWHHIIDPRTGLSAKTDVVSATICTPTATSADVLASCAIILGSDPAATYLKDQKIENYILQYISDGKPKCQCSGKLISMS